MTKSGSAVKVLFVTTELAPFSKVGGLGDVAGSLPKALRQAGVDVRVVTPAWPGVLERVAALGVKTTTVKAKVYAAYDWRIHSANIIKASVDGVTIYFLDAEDYSGSQYPSQLNFWSASPFAVFCMQALELKNAIDWEPDIYHCHDWTSAFLPCALAWHRHYRQTGGKSIMTLHNVAYQGIFEPYPFLEASGLEPWSFNASTMEFYGQVNLLKGGIVAATAVTTVSPTYANEIQTYESTRELSGILYQQRSKLRGIINGLDVKFWDPNGDKAIPAKFSVKDLKGKAACKKALLERAGFDPKTEAPVIVCVSRLVEQKGFDMVFNGASQIAETGAKLLILGSGNDWIENGIIQASEAYPQSIKLFKGYDEPLSHLMYAGGDIFLMPSVFEPCGLSQMISMRYGTVPVVREVGGLRDTVFDVDRPEGGNGFTFQTCDVDGMMWALRRAVDRYNNNKVQWKEIMLEGMREDFTWDKSAGLYKNLYDELMQ